MVPPTFSLPIDAACNLALTTRIITVEGAQPGFTLIENQECTLWALCKKSVSGENLSLQSIKLPLPARGAVPGRLGKPVPRIRRLPFRIGCLLRNP